MFFDWARFVTLPWVGLLACVGLAVLTPGCTSSSGSGSGASRIVYLTAPDSKGVLVYRLNDSSGKLSQSVGSPYPTGGSGTPDAVYVAPSGNILYVLNAADNNIGRYTIDPTLGSISELPPRVATGVTPVSMTMNSTGTCLFVADQDSFDLAVYSVDATSGALTQVQRVSTIRNPSQILAANKFLYVLNVPLRSILVYSYTVDSSGKCTGGLQPVGSPAIVGIEPKFMIVDPKGNYLYVGDSANDEVDAFILDANTGALSSVVGSPFSSQTTPVAMAIDAGGQYLYVANSGSNNIRAFTIGDGGSLSEIVDPGPFPANGPSFLAVSPDTKYLLAASHDGKKITAYSILGASNNTTAGALGTSPVSTSTAFAPTSIVIRQ